MPPKRKAAQPKTKGGKVAKVVIKDEKSDIQKAVEVLTKADKCKVRKFNVDKEYPFAGGKVHGDYDCMLNQTNIGNNNNKFYVIQVIEVGVAVDCWTRWGRVGESGQNKNSRFGNIDDAVKEFVKKFKDKTRNNWADRADFKPAAGKYTLIEMDGDEEDEVDDAPSNPSDTQIANKKVLDCTLDKETRSLVKLIFDHDMFKEAMSNFDIDVKKMPLGKLSKSQIAKGFEVIEEIETAVSNKASSNKLQELSSKFYTSIPHNFKRERPPVISSSEVIQQKKDMLLVLGDIELTTSLQKDQEKEAKNDTNESMPHPLDVNYGLLKCSLELLDKGKEEFKAISKYTESTKSSWRKCELKNVWKICRDGEDDRFAVHDDIDNRKLLWHGSNVAVTAAILKSGLRIMPHSGGRVGRGIYFASEHCKSAGYVGVAGKTGIMYLNEVALGEEHGITQDDSSLRKAPKGFDSIVARGRTEPDPKLDIKLELDGKNVIVPQGKPIQQAKYNSSSFSQSEYLVYKESQVKMRYLLEFKFDY